MKLLPNIIYNFILLIDTIIIINIRTLHFNLYQKYYYLILY